MLKTRFYVVPSSLGAYFGLTQAYGVSPLDQLEIDLGNQEAVYDDKAQARMDLGAFFEGPILDYFETILDCKITDRNDNIIYGFNELIKCKIDGLSNYQGLPTGIECKMSNSKAMDFIDNKSYLLQCQAYMAALGYDRWLLLGLQNGVPMYKLLHRDEDVIADIKEMVETVSDILNGLKDKEDFPWHLVEKYSGVRKVADAQLNLEDTDLAIEYETLKLELGSFSGKQDRLKEIEGYFKSNYSGKLVLPSGATMAVFETKGRTTTDMQRFRQEHPEIDMSTYEEVGEPSKSIRYTKAKE